MCCNEFTKDEIISCIKKGYKLKVEKRSYLFFEKEEDYLNLFILEKVYNDFYNNLLSDRDCEIRSYFRMTLIKKFIETLPPIRIVAYYDYNRSENSFKVKFPNVGELNIIIDTSMNEKSFDKLEDIENEDLQKKYFKSILMLEDEKIKVRYFIKNEEPDNFVNRCFFMPKKRKPRFKLIYESPSETPSESSSESSSESLSESLSESS